MEMVCHQQAGGTGNEGWEQMMVENGFGSSFPRGSVRYRLVWKRLGRCTLLLRQAPGDRWFARRRALFKDEWLRDLEEAPSQWQYKTERGARDRTPCHWRWLMRAESRWTGDRMNGEGAGEGEDEGEGGE